MNRCLAQITIATFALAMINCAGASKSKIKTMEEQIKQLQDQMTMASPDGGENTSETESKGEVDALKKDYEAHKKSAEETIQRFEDSLRLVQEELAKASSGTSQSATTSETKSPSSLDAMLDGLLGTEDEVVKIEEETVSVKRNWFLLQLQNLAITAKGPKFVPNKKGGVAIRSIKPKSLLDTLGLKNNDLITHIADQEIKETVDISKALKSAAGPLTVKFLRKKKETAFTYQFVD